MEHWRFWIKDSIYHYTDVTIKSGSQTGHSALHGHLGISLCEGYFLKTLAPTCWTESSFPLSPLRLSLDPRAENLSLTKAQVPRRRVFILLALLLGQQRVPAFVPELRQQLHSAWTLSTTLLSVLNRQLVPQCEHMCTLTSRPAHTYTHTCICAHPRTNMHMHANTCTCTHPHPHLHMHAHTHACLYAHPSLHMCTPTPMSACAHLGTHCIGAVSLGGSRVDHDVWWIGATLNTSARCEQPPPRKGQAISTTEVSGGIHHGLTWSCYLTTMHRTLYVPVLGILCSEETGWGSGRAEYPVRSRFCLSQAPHYIFSSTLELN